MKKSDQAALLNVMETGILNSIKVRKTRERKMRLWVFATSNNLEKISEPLKLRFLVFYLKEYTCNEFMEIAIKLLYDRYNITTDTASKIAERVWE
jgi:hypothetical protein